MQETAKRYYDGHLGRRLQLNDAISSARQGEPKRVWASLADFNYVSGLVGRGYASVCSYQGGSGTGMGARSGAQQHPACSGKKGSSAACAVVAGM